MIYNVETVYRGSEAEGGGSSGHSMMAFFSRVTQILQFNSSAIAGNDGEFISFYLGLGLSVGLSYIKGSIIIYDQGGGGLDPRDPSKLIPPLKLSIEL